MNAPGDGRSDEGVALKAMAEALAVASGAPSLARRMTRGRVRILAYHNVAPDDADAVGEPALHVPRSRFAEQLDLLMDSHEVVPLHSVVEAERSSSSRPRAVITFDDAYRGAMTAGVEELSARGLPGTVFVSPGLLGGQAFWWDGLAEVAGGALDDDVRETALSVHGGRQHAVLDAIRTGNPGDPGPGEDVPAWARSASHDELSSAAGEGMTLASHGWSHPNLTRVSPAELRDELARPLDWLRRNFPGRWTPWLSYPYGLASTDVERVAREIGYRGAVLTGGGCARPRDPEFALPRISVPRGLSRRGFLLRISGLPLP